MRQQTTALFMTLFFLGACASGDPNQKAKRGAAVGAAVGAIAGAIVGNQSGNPQTGAVIGAAAGAAIGGGVGHRMDQQQQELRQIEGVEVTRTSENELEVVMRNNILFDYDSYDLRPASIDTLRRMADVFHRYDETALAVEGHTDSMGSDAYNQTLSERRAYAVADYLASEGVTRSRIAARGFGESDPVATNDTPEGRQLNRRVEIRVTAPPDPVSRR